MDDASIIGLSRQIVLGRALDVAANNIANQTTTGYKAEQIRFEEYLTNGLATNPAASDRLASNRLTVSPTNHQPFSLVVDPDSRTDFSQGSLTQTSAPLDFSITGDGFFGIDTPAGIQFTRDGHFSTNAFGELVTRDGYLVLDDTQTPILIDPDAGPLILTPQGALQQGNELIATLGIFQFTDNRSLTRSGQNLFSSTQEPTAVVNPAIQQGFVENANVSAIEGMTQMIKISRAYAQAAQLIETTDELSRDAIRTFTETR